MSQECTIHDVIRIINSDYLEYAVLSYLRGESEDDDFDRIWDEVSKAMRKLEKHIEDRMGEDFEWYL